MRRSKQTLMKFSSYLNLVITIGALITLTACGGGNGNTNSSFNSSTAISSSSSLAATTSSSSSVSSSKVSSASISSATNTAYNTAGIKCDWTESVFNSDESVRATSDSTWTCSGTMRNLSANGLPDHEVGTFPNANDPNTISAQNVQANYTLTPKVSSVTGTAVATVTGYALNGVKLEPATGGTCDNSGANCSMIGGTYSWRLEALGQSSFNFGTDENNAHVQPNGSYHYHGIPEKFVTKLGLGTAMTLVGWAIDGFPVYVRYGYSSANDATSALKLLKSSYRVKATPDANRPATSLYAMGTFTQDYEYAAGTGDLDECNGRTGVTPEFPQGIYYYVMTESYPYIQRCVKGK